MRSLPEIWFLQVVIGIVLWFPMTVLNTVFMALSTSGDFSATTANIKTFLSPKVLEMLACCFLMVLLLIIGEIFVPIFLSVAIQKQEKIRVFSIIKKSIKALPCLFTPTGFLILLNILFVSPLIGMGVYLSMTEHLYLPHFISEVIDKNMATAALYRWAIIILTLLGFIHIFVLLSVPTLEEILDDAKGKVKLFLELKGESADHDMVEDVVNAVKARNMVDDVVLISLNYDVIDYAERVYPEMETGVLIFGSLGDVTKLNCDIIIMEEEMASYVSTIRKIHCIGKRTGVWTVNTERSMRRFLDSEVDMVITDDILMANAVQKELDERSDYEVLEDRSGDLWFF